jgi:hypothetical protein
MAADYRRVPSCSICFIRCFHARLAVLQALADLRPLLGRQHAGGGDHGLRHPPAHLVVQLHRLQPHLLGGVGVDRRSGEDLHAPATQVAGGGGLALQVGAALGHDLLDLGALRVAGVHAVEQCVDHPTHALGRAAHHARAAHAAVVMHALYMPCGRLRGRRAVCAQAETPIAASSVSTIPIITSLTRLRVRRVRRLLPCSSSSAPVPDHQALQEWWRRAVMQGWRSGKDR